MDTATIWKECTHLAMGTCPQVMIDGNSLAARGTPRPEWDQDEALARLAQACQTCALSPAGEK